MNGRPLGLRDGRSDAQHDERIADASRPPHTATIKAPHGQEISPPYAEQAPPTQAKQKAPHESTGPPYAEPHPAKAATLSPEEVSTLNSPCAHSKILEPSPHLARLTPSNTAHPSRPEAPAGIIATPALPSTQSISRKDLHPHRDPKISEQALFLFIAPGLCLGFNRWPLRPHRPHGHLASPTRPRKAPP